MFDTHSSMNNLHCVKIVRIRSFSGPYFPAFGLKTERCGVSLRIQSECAKMQTRKTPNTDTFHAVSVHFRPVFSSVSIRSRRTDPTIIYLFKVNNRSTRKRYEICLKLTIKATKRHHWRPSGVFIVNFEHISHLFLVFLLLTLTKKMLAGEVFVLRKRWSAKLSKIHMKTPEKPGSQQAINGDIWWYFLSDSFQDSNVNVSVARYRQILLNIAQILLHIVELTYQMFLMIIIAKYRRRNLLLVL